MRVNIPKVLFGLLAATAVGVSAYAAPALAHHAFGAEFDPDAPIRLEGEIVLVEWVNPHSWIHIAVEAEGGAMEEWAIEGGTPNVLQRRGLLRDCLTPGMVLVVDGYQAKDHTLRRANGRDVTFPDGRKFFMGSSGTGAPDDGAEQRGLQAGNQGGC